MQYTSHLRLPLFESADKPTWLYDWNETMTKLDDIIFNMSSQDLPPEVAAMLARIEALERTVAEHSQSIDDLEDDITSILTDIGTIQTTLTSINSLIPANATPSNQLATMADVGGSYVLPAATASTLGGIKVGSGLSITQDGTLSATGGSGGSGSGGMTLLASGDITTSDIDQGYLGFVETIDSTNCDMIALLLKVNGQPIFNTPTPILSANMSYSGAPAISYDVNVGSQNRTLGIYYYGNHANHFAVDLSGFSSGDSCRFEYEIYGLSTGSGGGSGGGSSISVDLLVNALDYVFDELSPYYAYVRIPLDGKPIGMTINMAHTFIFDADTLSQQTPPIIYEENNTHGGTITYALSKDGDVWYLEVYGVATEPAHDGFDVYVMLSKASQTPTPPSGDVTTITDPQVTSGASTLNAETLSITDVTPLS